jgi:hypothetical protein
MFFIEGLTTSILSSQLADKDSQIAQKDARIAYLEAQLKQNK